MWGYITGLYKRVLLIIIIIVTFGGIQLGIRNNINFAGASPADASGTPAKIIVKCRHEVWGYIIRSYNKQ